jgi:hypothetical protein
MTKIGRTDARVASPGERGTFACPPEAHAGGCDQQRATRPWPLGSRPRTPSPSPRPPRATHGWTCSCSRPPRCAGARTPCGRAWSHSRSARAGVVAELARRAVLGRCGCVPIAHRYPRSAIRARICLSSTCAGSFCTRARSVRVIDARIRDTSQVAELVLNVLGAGGAAGDRLHAAGPPRRANLRRVVAQLSRP